MERTLAALNQAPEAEPREVLKTVREAVDAFVGEAAQFDDLTMLCFRYYGVGGNTVQTEKETETEAERHEEAE